MAKFKQKGKKKNKAGADQSKPATQKTKYINFTMNSRHDIVHRACELAMRSNQDVILHDIPRMNNAELLGVINYLNRSQDC